MGLNANVLEELAATVTKATPFSIAQLWQSLHTANPGTSGTSEASGGGYSRQQSSWTGSGGSEAVSADVTFNLPAGTFPWLGYWTASAGGTFLGGFPIVSTQQPATIKSGSQQWIVPGHAWIVNTPVRLFAIPGMASAVPVGFTADTTYYVVSVVDADTVTLSATLAGSPIWATSSGVVVAGVDQKIVLGSPGSAVFSSSAPAGLTYQAV